MAPLNQSSRAMVPMSSGLVLALGAMLNWLMQPVWPWLAWLHFTPFTQMLIEPGKADALLQPEGWLCVVYSPTTCSHALALMRPQTGCQSAPEPRPAELLNT